MYQSKYFQNKENEKQNFLQTQSTYQSNYFKSGKNQPVFPEVSSPVKTPSVNEADGDDARGNLELHKDAFLYGAGKVGTGILGALEGANDFIGSAFYGAVGGLSDLVGADRLADFSKKKAASYLENSITDDLNQKLEEKYKPTDAMQMAGTVNETVSGLLPSIAAGNIAGAAGTGLKAAEQAAKGANVSKALFGLTAAGGASSEAKKEGATLGQALAYGAAAGLLETSIEGIAGGIPGMGEGKVRQIAAKLTANPAVAKILDIVGEGGEEALTTFVTPYLKRAMYNENAQNATAEEIAQSAAMGMIASGILRGGLELPGAIGNQLQNKQAGAIPGSGLDGTPSAQDGIIPVQDGPATQTTPSGTETTQILPGVDTSGRFGAVEGEKNASAKAETEQMGNKGETVSIIQKLNENIPNISRAQPVHSVSVKEVQISDGRTMAQKARELFEKIKGTVTRSGLGEVEINTRSVKDDLSHGVGPAKAAVIPAIPSVIQNGEQIDYQKNWKGRPYDGYVFAAPVMMDGETVYVAAVVLQTSKNRFYLHEVVDSNGNTIKISSEEGANLTSLAAKGDAGTQSPLLSDTNVPYEAQDVNNQYTQNAAPAFISESGLDETSAVSKSGTNLQSSDGSVDESYWDSIMEEQKLPFSETDVDGYMEALLADVDQRLNRATPKDTPVTEEYEPPKKGKKAKRADKSPTEHERVKEIVLDPEVTGSKSITTEFAQALSSSGISYNKDLARNLDAAGAGSAKLREGLRNLIERPFRAAGKSYANNVQSALNDLKKTMDALGIKMGSKESAAVQRYGEGQYQDETGEVREYTEAMLREEFPESWQNIVKAAQYCRQLYDGYVDRINATLEQIYPNALGKAMEEAEYQNSKAGLFSQMAEEQQQTYNSLQERLNERKKQLEKSREGTQRYADLQNTIHRIEQQMENVQGKISSLRNQVDVSNAKAAAIHARIASGEVLRNKQVPKRSDYFHHFNEMAEGWAGLANILTTPSDIDSTLAGASDHTKPKTRWAGFMQGRKGGAYTEDAVGGLLKYIPQAEYKISFDPIIAENRNIIKTLAEETENSRNANKFIEWMTDWTNDIAGKTNPFDRAVQKVVSRKGIAVAKWLSSRAKANAVVGNVRSATAQVFNLPNAMVYIKSPKAWKSGAAIYGRALGGDQTAKSLFEESGFLSERYMNDAISQFDEGILKRPEKFANWMLTVGDKEVAKLIWASAYEQGRADHVADPVEYADDITRRSIAGRGVGDVPLMQKAVVTQLFAPFQIEVNNTWQLMKEAGADKNWTGLLAMFIMSFLMNSVTRELFGYDVGIDPFNAVIEGVQDWDDEKTAAGNVLGVAGRLGGEMLSNMPFGAQIGSTLISDEYDREKIFGDTDPSRFGTGNIGINAMADTLVSGWDAISEGDITKVDLMTPATNFLLPYGGKQVGRVIEGAQDLGLIPVAGKEGITRQPDAGSMSDTGRLRFAIDESNPFDVAKLFAFGPFATSGGIDYLEDGMLPLSEKRTAEAMAAAERGFDLVDYMEAYRATSKADTMADKLQVVGEMARNEEMAKELLGIAMGYDLKTEGGNPTQYAKMLDAMETSLGVQEVINLKNADADMDRFLGYTDAGLNAESAYDLSLAAVEMRKDEDIDGAFTISENARLIEAMGLTEEQQEIAWLVMYPEWASKANKKDVSTTEYIAYKKATYGLTKKADKLASLRAAGFSVVEAAKLYKKIG